MQILTYATPKLAEVAVTSLMPNYIAAPYNQFVWAKSWHKIFQTEYLGILVLKDQIPYWFIDFEVIVKNSIKIARNIGGSHANFHFPIHNPYASEWTEELQNEFKGHLYTILKQYKIEALECENNLHTYHNINNPLLNLTKKTVIDELLYAELKPDFESFAQEVRGNSGRKRDRKQDRILHDIGEWYCYEAITHRKRQEILSAFFEQKKDRLAIKGIQNNFSDSQIQAFFIELSSYAHPYHVFPYFRLSALVLNNKIVATSSSLSNGSHCSGMFNSFNQNIANEASPGLSLQRFEIETLCKNGLTYFDMGVGEARYKHSWLKKNWKLHSFIVPITWKGHILAFLYHCKLSIKIRIKTTPWLWALAQKIRKLLHKQSSYTETD